jgi:type I restriction enzyme S subunit
MQETAKIDKLISVIHEGIKKLKEYNAALISAAVTGKIDVRGEVEGVAGEEAAL